MPKPWPNSAHDSSQTAGPHLPKCTLSSSSAWCIVTRSSMPAPSSARRLHALIQQPLVIASVQTRLESLITTLDAEIATVEQEIAAALDQEAAWTAAAARLATISGLGTLTIAWILTTTINFTLTVTPEAAANYAGLAPQLRQSGTSVRGRPRVGHGGNARLRRAVYMATLSAVQHNQVIKAFYTRLCAALKPRKVALCAAARKLL